MSFKRRSPVQYSFLQPIKKDSDTSDNQNINISHKKIKLNANPAKQLKTKQKQFTYSDIKFIPQYRLSVEQMNKDPIQLLTQLQEKYCQFGAIKLITPKQWQPPFCFKYTDKGITTRIQKIHKLKKGKVIFF